MLTVINYEIGNLRSVTSKLTRLGLSFHVASTPAQLADAKRIILPGVGHFDAGMRNLRQLGFEDILRRKVFEENTPLLGICLGLQLFAEGSEEGTERGLGWIPLRCRRFSSHGTVTRLRIPHMGWNRLKLSGSHPLLQGLSEERRFYFAHSYYLDDPSGLVTIASCGYGLNFCAVMVRGNIAGVQFHPEKSHHDGLQLLKNFSQWTPQECLH